MSIGQGRRAGAAGIGVLMALAGAGHAGATEVPRLLAAHHCGSCHALDRSVAGPAFRDIASRYAGQPGADDRLARKIREGGAGAWGPVPMPPFSGLSEGEAQQIAGWVLAQK
jgi:cytochrome c551/c552